MTGPRAVRRRRFPRLRHALRPSAIHHNRHCPKCWLSWHVQYRLHYGHWHTVRWY